MEVESNINQLQRQLRSYSAYYPDNVFLMVKATQCIPVIMFHLLSARLQKSPLHLNGVLHRNEVKRIQLCKLLCSYSLPQLKAVVVISQPSLRLISSGCYLYLKPKSNCNADVFPLQTWPDIQGVFFTLQYIYLQYWLLCGSFPLLCSIRTLLYDIHLY